MVSSLSLAIVGNVGSDVGGLFLGGVGTMMDCSLCRAAKEGILGNVVREETPETQ